MTLTTGRRRSAPPALIAALALTATALVGAGVSDASSQAAAPAVASSTFHATGASMAERMRHEGERAALRKQMRVLWEQHMEWTYATVASFASGAPNLTATLNRLLQNQTDLGNAIEPYYGQRAANRLAELLRTHIEEAVPVLTAAQAGDQAALTSAIAAWKTNARQIADFLAAANPHWGRAEMRTMMATHIDQTVAYAAAQLEGHYARSIRLYGHAEHHMLQMADMLSNGIIAQVPGRF
jgi:hypothetical protein